MKITDGNRTVEIEMVVWDESSASFSPDWSADCFNAGTLPYDEETDTYTVGNVQDCIDYAIDWRDSIGDFRDDYPNENSKRFVLVDRTGLF